MDHNVSFSFNLFVWGFYKITIISKRNNEDMDMKLGKAFRCNTPNHPKIIQLLYFNIFEFKIDI